MAFDGVKIGVLWRNKNANGQDYFSGKIGDATLLVMENREAAADNNLPHFNVFVSTPRSKPAKPTATAPQPMWPNQDEVR